MFGDGLTIIFSINIFFLRFVQFEKSVESWAATHFEKRIRLRFLRKYQKYVKFGPNQHILNFIFDKCI